MANPRYARWLPLGLVIVSSQVVTAVQAASPTTPASFSHRPTDTTADLFHGETLTAQIIPDNTLGDEASGVLENGDRSLINGGAIRGSNLFHSFQDFNVNNGQQVYFANPADIETILSRVTGGNGSTIDGLLGVDGTASLFLLNPNGIVFGPNAQLDIRGSFTASTADRLAFADGRIYSAANPQGASLLTMSVPLGVQFSTPPSGNLVSTATLTAGKDLTLSGQQLYLEGQLAAEENLTLLAQDTVTIRDTETDAFTARSGNALTIQGNQGIDILTLQHLETRPFLSRGDLRLISDGEISADAHLQSGGRLQFLTLAETPATVVSLYDPIIVADGDVVFGDYRGVALKVEATGSIQAGNIRITGPDVTLTADGSGSDEDLLASSQAAILRAGVAAVGGSTLPETVGGTTFSAATPTDPPGSLVVDGINTINASGGDGGPIILEAEGDITLLDNVISAGQSFNDTPAGNGGNISILSRSGDIVIKDRVNAFSLATVADASNSGDISIIAETGDIFIDDNVTAFSIALAGDATTGGDILILAESGDILIDGADINTFAIASQGNTGDGGNLSITAEAGNIAATGALNTFSTAGNNAGNGGEISAFAPLGDTVLGNLGTFSEASTGISSDGGDISIVSQIGDISTERLTAFSISTTGPFAGNGGNILVSTGEGNISTNGNSATFSVAELGDTSDAGDISFSTGFGNILANGDLIALAETFAGNAGRGGEVSVSSGFGDISIGIIDSYSFAQLDAGEGLPISVTTVAGNIAVGNVQSFSSSSFGTAQNAGNILILSESGNVDAVDADSLIEASSFEEPLSGDIFINGVVLSSSFSVEGDVANAGDVSIITKEGTISGSDQNPISALSASTVSDQTGDGGIVTLEANGVSDLVVATISSSGVSGDVVIRSAEDDLTVSDVDLITSGQVVVVDEVFSRKTNSGEPIFQLTNPDFDQSGTTVITSAGDLVLDNVQILSDANQAAAAGDVDITSAGDIQINNSQILSNTNVGSSGNGGGVRITGDSSLTLNNSFVNTDTEGSGRAGSLSLASPQLNIQNGTRVTAETSSPAIDGTGGNVEIRANEINLAGNNTEISVSTSSAAGAGSITLEPFTQDGNITLFTLDEGPQFSASTAVGSRGRGGDIILQDADIALLRNTDLVTSSRGAGNAGNIVVQDVNVLLLRQGSLIQAGASASGDGGSIDIDAGLVITVANEDNDILADTTSGRGGDIEITAERILGFREVTTFSDELRGNEINDISARSERGVDGEVNINNFAVDPNQGLTELPVDVSDPANQIAQGCNLDDSVISQTGDFVITGRGGQLVKPTDVGSTQTSLDDLGPDIEQSDTVSLPAGTSLDPSPSLLTDAQEAVITTSGEVFLVAADTWQSSLSCALLN